MVPSCGSFFSREGAGIDCDPRSRGTQVVNSNTYEMARRAARNFLNNLKLPARWEGKIDGAGNILESPLKL
jgi:hypothetical protein